MYVVGRENRAPTTTMLSGTRAAHVVGRENRAPTKNVLQIDENFCKLLTPHSAHQPNYQALTTPVMDTLTLKLQGMSCASCANYVERAIISVPGVINCYVNFAAQEAAINYDHRQTDLAHIQAAIDAAGYSSSVANQEMVTSEDDVETKTRLAAQRELTLKVGVGSVIGILLLVGSLPMMTGLNIPVIPGFLHNPWVQLVLTTPVQFWCGGAFLSNGWKALKRRTATMDTLIALGTGTAYLYSLVVTLFPELFIAQG